MIDDLPVPDDPSSATVRPGARYASSWSIPVGWAQLVACTGTRGAMARMAFTASSGAGQRSVLFSTTTGAAPLSAAATR